jgi:hypothetical protein
MRVRLVLVLALSILCTLLLPVGGTLAAQEEGATWQSSMLWYPSLEEAGIGLADLVNQIDASCGVDVDNVTIANGTAPEGTVYAFAVTWSCPPGATGERTWQSSMLWQPSLAETGEALASFVNEIEAGCRVDVDPVVAASGSGPEGAVYAFAITWAC